MDLCTSGIFCLGLLMLCVVGDAWTGMTPVLPVISISCGSFSVFGVSSGVVASLLGLMARSIYGIDSGGVISMCGVTSI